MTIITRRCCRRAPSLTHNTWALGPMLKLVRAFKESVRTYPNTLPGEPD
ncbi:arylsulfatase [Pandoraea thiooxydans]|nr:hypothetical protein [Pandoraea thiooxydans]APR94581.1 arylsulfatase [Pandoraea thiooxydans]